MSVRFIYLAFLKGGSAFRPADIGRHISARNVIARGSLSLHGVPPRPPPVISPSLNLDGELVAQSDDESASLTCSATLLPSTSTVSVPIPEPLQVSPDWTANTARSGAGERGEAGHPGTPNRRPPPPCVSDPMRYGPCSNGTDAQFFVQTHPRKSYWLRWTSPRRPLFVAVPSSLPHEGIPLFACSPKTIASQSLFLQPFPTQ